MLKFKGRKEFSIVFNAQDCTDNKVYDYVLSDKECSLIMENCDVFVFTSAEDIDEWNEQFEIGNIDEWNNVKKDWSLDEFFEFVEK